MTLLNQDSRKNGNRYTPLTIPLIFPHRRYTQSGTDFFKKKNFDELIRFHGVVDGHYRSGMAKSLKKVFQSILFRYTFVGAGETDLWMDSTLPYLKYYSHESLQDELGRVEEMKERMKSENENGVKEINEVFKEKKEVFRKTYLSKFVEWVDRNEELEKSIAEKTTSGTVKINFHTILSRIILNCSDSFEIIFSYVPMKDLIQRISLSCSFFYSFIRRRVRLSMTITKKLVNVDYNIIELISSYQLRRIDLDCGEYLEFSKQMSLKDKNTYEGILNLIKKNRRSLEHLDFGTFRGTSKLEYNYRCGKNHYTLMPKDMMDAIRSCSRLKTLKIIHLTDPFSDFVDSMGSSLRCFKFSIEDLIFNTSRNFEEELTPKILKSSRLQELSVVHCILKNYQVPDKDVAEVVLRKTRFNDFICTNLTDLKILHTNFIDCREFTELFTRFLVHRLEKVTIIRNHQKRMSEDGSTNTSSSSSVYDYEKESLKVFEERTKMISREISRREKENLRIPNIQFIYYNEYCEMTPLKMRYKKSERSTYNYAEEIQLLLDVPHIYIQMSSSMVVRRKRSGVNLLFPGNVINNSLVRENVGLIPLLDFSESRIRTLYLNQDFYFTSHKRVDQKLTNLLSPNSNIEDLIISFRDRDTLMEICELVPKTRGLKFLYLIIERGVATLEEKKIILEKILSLVEKNIPSLEKIAIYGNTPIHKRGDEDDEGGYNYHNNDEDDEDIGNYRGTTTTRTRTNRPYYEGPYVFDVSELEVMSDLKKMKELFLEKLSNNPFLDELWMPDLGKDFQKKIDEVLIVNQSVYSK